jgi:hypothetical protein
MTAEGRHALPASTKLLTGLVIFVTVFGGSVFYLLGANRVVMISSVAAVGAVTFGLASGTQEKLDPKTVRLLLVLLLAGEIAGAGMLVRRQYFVTLPVPPSRTNFQNVTVGDNFNVSFPVPVSRQYLRLTFQAADANAQAPSCARQVRFGLANAQTGRLISASAFPGVPYDLSVPRDIQHFPLNVSVSETGSDSPDAYSDCVVDVSISASLTN